jgi:uncharacterized membrane protein
MEVRHVSISVDSPPEAVYGFAAKVENLPKWATGLCQTIRNVNGEWIADGPVGKVKVRFAERNAFGVLDMMSSWRRAPRSTTPFGSSRTERAV